MSHMSKGRFLWLLAAIPLMCAGLAFGQADYPSRPVQFVVPYSPGGATDIITRIMSDQFQIELHQPFPVENRTGAGGGIGAGYVANSAPDGYTIFMGSPGPLVTNQFLYPSMPYDSTRAFAPVVLVAKLPNVLVVHPSLGIKTVQELIDKARTNPGAINFASGGTGSSGHLSMELFKAMSKTDFTHIPYKGTGQLLQDVIAGRVPVVFDNLTPILPYIKSGALIPLGVSTSTPVAALPDVPPVAETVPGFEASSWVAVVAPAGTPAAAIERLNSVANRILGKPDVRSRLMALTAEPAADSPGELSQFLASETVKWKSVIQTAGIKLQE
jgi:tripartite-type tricarboxylate transporter receptor subunit TctC